MDVEIESDVESVQSPLKRAKCSDSSVVESNWPAIDSESCVRSVPFDNRERHSLQHLPEGPSSPEEVFEWPQWACSALATCMSSLGMSDAWSEFKRKISTGLQLLTDYSGVGAAEEAMRLLVKEAELAEPNFTVQHASDVDVGCRDILGAHPRESRASCLFGDLLERTPAELRETWIRQHSEAKSRHQKAAGAGDALCQAHSGQKFLREVVWGSKKR